MGLRNDLYYRVLIGGLKIVGFVEDAMKVCLPVGRLDDEVLGGGPFQLILRVEICLH